MALSAVQASDHGAWNGRSGRRLLTWLAAVIVNVIGTPGVATDADGVQFMPVTVFGSAPPATKQLTLIGPLSAWFAVNVTVKLAAAPPRVTFRLAGAPLIEKSAGAGGAVFAPVASSLTSL
jgi:hypothetical protein